MLWVIAGEEAAALALGSFRFVAIGVFAAMLAATGALVLWLGGLSRG